MGSLLNQIFMYFHSAQLKLGQLATIFNVHCVLGTDTEPVL